MVFYRVKLNVNHKAPFTSVKCGYLAFAEGWGKFAQACCVYTRGEAIKKANMFEIPQYAINKEVQRLIEPRQIHKGMYGGDVFFDTLSALDNVSDSIRVEIVEFAQIATGYDYVMLIY